MAPRGLALLVTRNIVLVCRLKDARFSPFFRLLSFELPPRRLLLISKSIGRFGRINITIKELGYYEIRFSSLLAPFRVTILIIDNLGELWYLLATKNYKMPV